MRIKATGMKIKAHRRQTAAVLTDFASSLAAPAPCLRSLPPSFAATFTSSAANSYELTSAGM